MPLLDGDLELRPFRAADEAAVLAMLREPGVARWWPDPAFERGSGTRRTSPARVLSSLISLTV